MARSNVFIFIHLVLFATIKVAKQMELEKQHILMVQCKEYYVYFSEEGKYIND